MEKYINWYLLQLKAWCKKKICWIQIAGMCIVVAIVSAISIPEKDNLAVGIANVQDSCSEEIARFLTAGDSLFSFQIYENEEIMRSDILAGRLECGFAFTDDFKEKLEQGKSDDSVTYIQTPFSAKGSVARETFYTAFLQVYSKQLLTNSMDSVYGEVKEETLEELLKNNQEYLNGENLFQIVQEQVETKGPAEKQTDSKTYPVRGLVALFLFAILFMEHGQKFEGGKAALFKALDRREKRIFEGLGYLATVTIAAVTGLVCILFTEESRGFFIETGLMLLYLVCAGLWVFLVGRLFRNQTSFMGWNATLLVTQILICPVFVDFSVYVQALRYIGYVFPLGIYLRLS